MTTATINGNPYSDNSAVGTRPLDNGGHRLWFLPLIQDIVIQAVTMQGNADTADTARTAAEAALAAILAVSGGTLGIGTEPLDLVRVNDLGTLAFLDEDVINGFVFKTQNGSYQINSTDKNKLLLTTSGTNTWTLPLLADLPPRWFTRIKNRSGNNLTINRSGSDTINAAATSLTVSNGSSVIIARSAVTTWESF
jgi:hypothetical protein